MGNARASIPHGHLCRMTELVDSPLPNTSPSSSCRVDEAADVAHSPSSAGPKAALGDFEAVLQQGFLGLRFPADMEARFQQDTAPERVRLLRIGAFLGLLLAGALLYTDWIMVPDRFTVAMQWRLLFLVPVLGLSVAFLQKIPSLWQDWTGLINSALSAGVHCYLCISSTDELAGPYLVTLSMIVLFNGGVTRMRFWRAMQIDLIVLALFGGAALCISNPNVPVLVGQALIMVSTTLFTLYNSYGLEREERTNWLMLQHEHQLLDKLERGNQRLDQITRFDPLTEIANRRHFDEFVRQVWSRCARDGTAVAVLMMDIDHFKLYNDHYGHPIGDACLKEVANTMARSLRRPGDLVARFGGEEFIAILSHTTLAEALAAAERVRTAVWELARPHAASLSQDRVTISIGVACLHANEPGASTIRLLAQADEALYQAKAKGRNQAQAFGEVR